MDSKVMETDKSSCSSQDTVTNGGKFIVLYYYVLYLQTCYWLYLITDSFNCTVLKE